MAEDDVTLGDRAAALGRCDVCGETAVARLMQGGAPIGFCAVHLWPSDGDAASIYSTVLKCSLESLLLVGMAL